MGILIENNTCILDYAAEQRDGSGVVASGTDVKLKVYNITQEKWWTGAVWGTETELTGTATAAGAWHYSFAIPDGDEGDFIQVVWYDETDGTVIQSDVWRICNESDMILKTLTDLTNAIEGIGSGKNVVTITLNDGDGNPVPGAFCVVRNVAESVEFGYDTTDVDGECEFQFDNGSYYVRFGAGLSEGGMGHGYQFDNPYSLTVSDTTAKTFTCTAVAAPAAGLTFAQLKDQLNVIALTMLGEQRKYVSPAALSQWVNSGYQEIDRKLRWTRCTYDLETVTDHDTYIVPSSVREYLEVRYTDDADQVRALEPMSLREMIAKQRSSTNSGDPHYYAHHGDRLYLYPAPDTGGEGLRIYIVGEPPDLSDAADTPGFPAHLHELIVDQALVYLCRHFGQLDQAMKQDAYIESKLATERVEPAVERTGPQRIQNDGF